MIKNGWIRDIEGMWYPMTDIDVIYVYKGKIRAISRKYKEPLLIWESFAEETYNNESAQDHLDEMM